MDCHEAGYNEMLRNWIHEVQEALGRSSLLAEDVRRRVQAARQQGQATTEAEALLREAEPLLQLVEKGKGAHNYALSGDLLQKADEKLREAMSLVGGALPPP